MLRLRKLYSLLGWHCWPLPCSAVVPTFRRVFCLRGGQSASSLLAAAGAGFDKAGKQMKVRTDFLGPNNYDAKAEREPSIRQCGRKLPEFCSV